MPEEVEPQPQGTPAPMYEARLVVAPPEEDDLFELDIPELSSAEPHELVAAPEAGANDGDAASGNGDVEPTVQVRACIPGVEDLGRETGSFLLLACGAAS